MDRLQEIKMTNYKKLAVWLLIAFLFVNLVVFALKLISTLLFWTIIIVIGIIAYKGLNKSK